MIPSGETKEISFNGELPKQSKVRAAVTVTYVTLGTSSYTPVGQRTFDFTIMNGPAPKYDINNPYADADFPAQIYHVLSESGISAFEQYGLTSVVNAFYTVIARMIGIIRTIVSVFQSISA